MPGLPYPRRSAKMGAWPTIYHTIDRWDDATGQNPVEQIAS